MHQGKDDLTKDLSYSKKNVEKFSEIQKLSIKMYD